MKSLRRIPVMVLLFLLAACSDLFGGRSDPILVEAVIGVGHDDAEENPGGTVNRFSSDLRLGLFPTIGLRFDRVDIPQGAEIIEAHIQFKTDEAHDSATTLLIEGEATDAADAFRERSFDLSSRPRTASAVPWTPPSWTVVGESGPKQRSPDIAAVIEEIVKRPGWERNNPLVVLLSGSGKHVAESFNGDPAGAPRLYVRYRIVSEPPDIAAFTVFPSVPDVDEAVTFAWSTSDPRNQPLTCELDIDGDGTAEYTVDDCTGGTQQTHRFEAEGRYPVRLRVIDSDGASRSRFETVHVVDRSSAVVVGAAGDIACDPTSDLFHGENIEHCQQIATSDLLLRMNPDAVLTLGDNAYEEGTPEQFALSYHPSWGRLKEITYPAVGNHEYLTPGASGYFQYFGPAAGDPDEGYYSFDLGDWHIVVLNSQCSAVGGCSISSEQTEWLREDLADNPAKCTLAYWHHPLFSSGRLGGAPQTRDFWRELYDAGADLVLVGHDHNYERFAPQDPDGNHDPTTGIRQFVVGTGGKHALSGGTEQPNSEALDRDTLGVLRLILRADSYEWEFLPVPGKTFTDSGSGECH